MTLTAAPFKKELPRVRDVDGECRLALETVRKVNYTVRNVPYGSAFAEDSGALGELLRDRNVVLVIDEALMPLYGERVVAHLSRHARLLGTVCIPGAEAQKTMQTLEFVCSALTTHGLDRNGVVVAVGGGAVLDLTGTAASLFRRGVRYIRVPTTLVGAVDVAVGIKQAINFANGKNLLGAFYPPVAAVVDRAFLRTLSKRDIACGVAEIVKMGLMCEPQLFSLMETYAAQLVESRFHEPEDAAIEAIVRAQASMMNELEPNLYEEELRRLVDFGHTFSPAMESASGYTLAHGEAVAIDMYLSTALAVSRGICVPEVLDRLEALYRSVGLPFSHETATLDVLMKGVDSARKHRAGALNFVLPTSIGTGAFVQNVTRDEVCGLLTCPR